MKQILTALTLGIIALFASTPIFAKAAADAACNDNKMTINSGDVNYSLTFLNSSIKNVKHELGKYPRHHNWRISKHSELKHQLIKLESTRQRLVDKMYVAGCDKFHDQASMSARIKKLENTLAELKKDNSQ